MKAQSLFCRFLLITYGSNEGTRKFMSRAMSKHHLPTRLRAIPNLESNEKHIPEAHTAARMPPFWSAADD